MVTGGPMVAGPRPGFGTPGGGSGTPFGNSVHRSQKIRRIHG